MLPRERHVFFTRKKQQQNNQVHGPAISFSLLASVYLYTLVLTYDLPVFDTLVFTSLHVDACVWIHLHMYVYTCIDICMPMCLVCIYPCLYLCVYFDQYSYVHITHTYIHAYIYTAEGRGDRVGPSQAELAMLEPLDVAEGRG